MNREEKHIIGLTTTSHFLVHLFEEVLPPLIPPADHGILNGLLPPWVVGDDFSYASGIGSLPSGFLADKVGPRRLITLIVEGKIIKNPLH